MCMYIIGYVLRELRLYKQLTQALESRKTELENGLKCLQQQHMLCVDKLQTAQLASTQLQWNNHTHPTHESTIIISNFI